jgi:hypothetical protein
MQHIVDDFEIPKHWKRIIAFDYGLADDSVFLFGAVNEVDGYLYIYDEIVTNDKNIKELSRLYFEGIKDIPSGCMLCAPIIDPKSASQRDYNKKTLADHFLDYVIAFIPGAINKEARIYRTNTYIELGYLKIMKKCKYLIDQLREYKFKTDGTDEQNFTDKPVDKDDHAIVCLEWILMELPADPTKLLYGAYNRKGMELDLDDPEKRDQAYAEWVFSDDKEDEVEAMDYPYYD